MRTYFIPTLILLSFVLNSCDNKQVEIQNDILANNKAVNIFIGTGGHGHTYPGAQLPFGMVQLSPDNGKSGWDWVSGYHYSDSVIVGFSHTHLSGAGIGDLQDISIMPTNKNVYLNKTYEDRLDKPYADFYTHSDEEAYPGYYRVNLKNSGIKAELTATERTGFHQYTFKDGEKNLLIDLGYAQNWDTSIDTEINFIDETTISGKRWSSGWAKDQRVFFYMKLSSPIKELIGEKNIVLKKGEKLQGRKDRALLKFDESTKQLKVKVALSSIDIEGAKRNLEAENSTWDFDQVKKNAEKTWAKELNGIEVETKDEEKNTVFYTSLYHAKLAPTLYSDVDNRYRGADKNVYKTDFNYYSGLSLWDVFRAQNPLLTITNPDVAVDIANTMLAHYDETGILPVWILAANETNTMTGYHSVSMLAEVIMKDLKGLDYEKAFRAMKSTMMQDQRGLKELREYSYIPYDLVNESVTIALELAYNDYGVAMVAQKLGYQEDYNYFSNRSKVYQHLFDKEVEFMRGKDSKGKWRQDFDPKHSSHRVNTDYTEGNAWQHSWFVLHDVQGLINQFGSDEAFEKKLTQLFNESSEITGDDVSPDITGLIGQYAHGNEPSHHIAYMYNYVGLPWKTQEIVHRIMREQYPNSPDGISGNEDMGQMSAWYVVSALGFYPVNPTDGNFILGTPLFEKSTIKLADNKKFEIIAHNHSETNFYVDSVKLNGKELNRTYINYKEIMKGGTLEFTMTDKPNKNWGKSIESRPPSLTKIK